MKIEIIYYELKRKEFRNKKTLNQFLKKKLPTEILRATEIKKGIHYNLELMQFLDENRY